MQTKNLTYTIPSHEKPPNSGDFLVIIGKRGINQVCIIQGVRKIKHKKTLSPTQAYRIEVYQRNDLKEYAEYEVIGSTANAWVRGQKSFPCFWLPRGKKLEK